MTKTTEVPQHMEALAKGNEVKMQQYELRKEVASGELSIAEALTDPRAAGKTFTIGKLLRAQHRWGVEKTRRFLFRLGIFEGRRVDALTERQRGLIARELEE